jgi:uncharacterized protein with NRDE domain
MCLILLAYRAHPDAPVILAGNRDEFYARPAAAPGLIARAPRIYAGRDLEAGGTWMGRNEHGLLAALTNRRATGAQPEARSRGEIVRALLACRTPAEAADWMAAQDVTRYRPFNVLFGDATAFYCAASRDGGTPRELEPGYHALSNSHLDDVSWPKVARALRFLRRVHGLDGEALLLALQAFLCDPTPPDDLPSAEPGEEAHGALGAVFVQTPAYGTVSATLLTAGGRLGDRYYFAEKGAMRAAQAGWARAAFGNGDGLVPSDGAGSPFRRLDFEE